QLREQRLARAIDSGDRITIHRWFRRKLTARLSLGLGARSGRLTLRHNRRRRRWRWRLLAEQDRNAAAGLDVRRTRGGGISSDHWRDPECRRRGVFYVLHEPVETQADVANVQANTDVRARGEISMTTEPLTADAAAEHELARAAGKAKRDVV